MVRIRLRRVGAKKQPSYRIVVADRRSPRDGRFIETIGHYNPRTEPETVNYDEGRALYWLSVGAQPTEAVHRLLNNGGTFGRLERLRQGEGMEALVEEALAEAEARPPISPKTRHDAPAKSAKTRPVEAEAAVAEAEAPEADAGEAEMSEAEAVAEVASEEPEAPEADSPEAEAPEAPEAEASEAEETDQEGEA